MVFHGSDSQSFQVSRTFLSILADLNNPVVCMVFICPLIFKSSTSFTNPLGVVPSPLLTTGITVTVMFHSFLFSSKVYVLISLFAFFILLCGVQGRQSHQFG